MQGVSGHPDRPRRRPATQPLLLVVWYLLCLRLRHDNDDVKIDEEAKTFELNGHKFVEGDWISIDGSTGNIYCEQVATVAAGNKNFNRFMG